MQTIFVNFLEGYFPKVPGPYAMDKLFDFSVAGVAINVENE